MLHRFFVNSGQIENKIIFIDDGEAQHIAKTLRLKDGAVLTFFDGEGHEFQARLAKQDKKMVAYIEDQIFKPNMPHLRLHLLQGMAKHDKMDLIVQKATELGVTSLTPLITDFGTVSLSDEQYPRRVKRWQSIVKESCKQCRRNTLLKIYPFGKWNDVLENLKNKHVIVLYEKETAKTLREVVHNWRNEQVDEIYLIIGPEGGLSASEVNKAENLKAEIVNLGPRILRTETAGLIGAGIILYEWQDLE